MRPKFFPTVLKVPADDDLRAALTRAAEAERTTVAEVARRALRAALAERPPATPHGLRDRPRDRRAPHDPVRLGRPSLGPSRTGRVVVRPSCDAAQTSPSPDP